MKYINGKSSNLFFLILIMVIVKLPNSMSQNIHRAKKSRVPSKEQMAVFDWTNTTFIGKETLPTYEDKTIKNNHLKESKTVSSNYSRKEAFLYALFSSFLVGLSGILPVIILPSLNNDNQISGVGSRQLKWLLSFAVGGLLGDVFLHLLPESWKSLQTDGADGHWPAICNGMLTLCGLISFCLLEKLFPEHLIEPIEEAVEERNADVMCNFNSKIPAANGHSVSNTHQSGSNNAHLRNSSNACPGTPPPKIKASGYLNLLANCIDNFTHGLAVGGSFLVSRYVGVVTTFAILLHEIPHEVGDFAILLRAGFTPWRAAKFQVLTAAGGLLGMGFAFAAESAEAAGDKVAWILPFTSGGFIYIALCTVVPDILKETSPRESLIQLFFLVLAIGIMYSVSLFE